jgi:uncharacterized iron-regulated membrane protein
MGLGDNPRRHWLRRALFQIHLWAGLGVGLYVCVSSISGSALVFHEELGEIAQARLRNLPAAGIAGQPRLTLDEAASAVKRALPDQPILSIAPPRHDTAPFEAGVYKGRYRLIFVHPVTGEVTGPVDAGGPVISWLHELHANLLSGGTGRWVNGIGGGMLFLLCVTGLVIWWPGRGKWARALKVDTRAGWKRLTFDLHNATGVWLLIPIAVLAITGSSYTWPRQYRAVISWFSPVTPAPAPKSDVASPGPRPTLDALVDQARALDPGAHIVRVATPGRPDQPYTVFTSPGAAHGPGDLTRYFFDQHSGKLLQVVLPGPRSAGDRLAAWIGPLHTGNFGGAGIKVLWLILGLAPAVLFGSGFLMWWNRVVTRRWRENRRSSERASSAVGQGLA